MKNVQLYTKHSCALVLLLFFTFTSCMKKNKQLEVTVYETSANGNKLTELTDFPEIEDAISIKLLPEEKFQNHYRFWRCIYRIFGIFIK